MSHGYCTAELIAWYVMKQLILPPDINEVTMQKEILTPPESIAPATLDQGHSTIVQWAISGTVSMASISCENPITWTESMICLRSS